MIILKDSSKFLSSLPHITKLVFFFLIIISLYFNCHILIMNIIGKNTVQISRYVPHFSKALECVLIFKYMI